MAHTENAGARSPAVHDERLRRIGATAGLIGPLLLAVYFATPALVGWPSTDVGPEELMRFAVVHSRLFYLGGWLQVTGALASALFFLVLVRLARAHAEIDGLATVVGVALLLAVVCVEAALLEAVPPAAMAQDASTTATAFALSNGVFARIFPLAPAPLVFAGIGAILLRRGVLPRFFGHAAIAVAATFLLAGLLAIVGTPGLILAVAMSIVQALWIAAAALALGMRFPRSGPRRTGAR